MPSIKIALVQKKAIPNDIKRNLELAVQYIKEASNIGADIVLFPEMWSNGYAPPFNGAFDNPLDPAFERERNNYTIQYWSLCHLFIKIWRKTQKHRRNHRPKRKNPFELRKSPYL